MKFKYKTAITVLIFISSCALTNADSFSGFGDFSFPTLSVENLGKHDKTCEGLHGNYSTKAGDYFRCAFENSNPKFEFCEKCVEPYQIMNTFYANLTTTINNNTGKPCFDSYINNNRMNVLYELSRKAEQLWIDASCDSCFDPWNANGTGPKPNCSIDTQHFFILTKNFTQCLAKYHNLDNNTICAKCEDDYTVLNAFYEDLRKSFGIKLCFDIVSSMNQTRQTWSGDLKCCRDKQSPLLMFYISAGFIGAMTIVFYAAAFILTRKETEEDGFPISNNDQPGPLTINSETSPVLSTIINRRTNNLHSPVRAALGSTSSTPQISMNLNRAGLNNHNAVGGSSQEASTSRPKPKKQNNIEAAKERKMKSVQPVPPPPPATGVLIDLSRSPQSVNGNADDALKNKLPPIDVASPTTDDDQLLS